MKIVHISDTHLGFSQLSEEDADGINIREQDAYNAFRTACRLIREIKPDLVIHSGDLFDQPHPPNRAIAVALKQFDSIARERIPIVMVVGNHSLPARHGTACIFEIFDVLPSVSAVFRGPKRVVIGNCVVHCIPHMHSEKEMLKVVEESSPDHSYKYNIMALHAGTGRTHKWTKVLIPPELINKKAKEFDYIALGHHHRFTQVASMACYSGSTERFHFTDTDDGKGFLFVDIDKKAIKHIKLPIRYFANLEPINCKDLSASEIISKIIDSAKNVQDGSILNVHLERIDQYQEQQVSHKIIKKLLGKMLHVQVHTESFTQKNNSHKLSSLPISTQFEIFIKERVNRVELQKTVIALSRNYFYRAKENYDT